MVANEATEMEQLPALTTHLRGSVEIVGAPPIVLQTLDLARHVAFGADGKRYVVASFEDSRMGRTFVTAIFPQQNGYLTLIRLLVAEFVSETPEDAVQLHISAVQAIQQGKLKAFLKAHQH